MKHYVYQITNLINNKTYIGVRSHPFPETDDYMSSSIIIESLIKIHGRKNFKKEILKKFETRHEAAEYESSFFTDEYIQSDLNYNRGRRGGQPHNMRKDIFYDFYESIRNEYIQGASTGELAKKYSCDKNTIKRVIDDIKRTVSESQLLRFKKLGHPSKVLFEDKLKIIPRNILDEIIQKYETGRSINSLALEYDVKLGFLRDIFIDLNIPLRAGSKHTFLTTYRGIKFKQSIIDNGDSIIAEFNLGKSKKELSKLFNCHEDTIQRFINLIILKK